MNRVSPLCPFDRPRCRARAVALARGARFLIWFCRCWAAPFPTGNRTAQHLALGKTSPRSYRGAMMINCCGLGDLIPRRVPWSPELQARMSLLAERVGDNWRAISLLSATMALSACTITTQAPIPPTATSPTLTPPLDEMRPLTPTEGGAGKDANANAQGLQCRAIQVAPGCREW